MIGRTLGRYEITKLLGKGGMGEVYGAKDTSLDREVAIKILPVELAKEHERRTRFEREAKTISSLSHPGICTLHDFGHHDGTPYIVMELLEGETLAERIRRGPLSIEDALGWGAEIAEALDCAHTRGIVHRDLKPSNVMLTATGPKLLDFGLAKETVARPDQSDISEANTVRVLDAPLTEQGAILGTLPYMAPEQLEGRSADTRTDIFALGVVLYEMLTGIRAFAGESEVTLAASIMEHEPEPISTITPQAPPALERAVRLCLAKDPDERWQSARDVARELRWIKEDPTSHSVPAKARSQWKWRERIAWAAAVSALIVAAYFGSRSPTNGGDREQRTTRFTFEASAWRNWPPAISPDGRKILYRAFNEERRGSSSFRIRFLDSMEPLELPSSDDYSELGFWSPDSRYVAFTAGGELLRVPIDGGPPETICSAGGHSASGDWHAAGVILFDGGVAGEQGIWRVDASGGNPVRVFAPDSDDVQQAFPSFLPDGRRCLFLETRDTVDGATRHRLLCGDLVTGETTDLGHIDSKAVYAEPGYLLYVSRGTLLARPFDTDRTSFMGEPRALAEIYAGRSGTSPFSVSSSGVLAYQLPSVGTTRLLWLDRTGHSLGSIEAPGQLFDRLRLSPDGQHVVVVLSRSQSEDIWIHDFARGTFSRLTVSPGQDVAPIWSADGRWIDYAGSGENGWHALRVAASGGGIPDTLATSDTAYWLRPADWSNDGGSLIVRSNSQETLSDILVVDVSGPGTLEPFLATRFNEHSPSLSPNGRWLAYVSNESGREEVYVSPFPRGEGRWQISRSGGQRPRWRGDGKEIVYCTDEHLVAVEVDTSEEFEASAPRNLFELPETVRAGYFDLTDDGERTIWAETTDGNLTTFVVVLNWADDDVLKRP